MSEQKTPLEELVEIIREGDRPTELLTYAEMSKKLRCTERHLANLVSLGLVPAIRMGKSVRFDPAEVIEALKAQPAATEPCHS